jgi:N-acetyl-anhydromuramyl-L-alanine amidase AmpD
MLPSRAVFVEKLAGGCALWDISKLLYRHRTKHFGNRKTVERIYLHHSGARGFPGFDGAANSARYVVNERGFPGPAYHYWLSYAPDVDANNRLVVYQLNPDRTRVWHTGGEANDHGIGVCWQGKLTGEEWRPSQEQYEMAEALLPWLLADHGLLLPGALSFHSEAGKYGGKPKAACPGEHIETWARNYRELA